MANNTIHADIIQDAFTAAEVIGRSVMGLIPSVNMDLSAEQVPEDGYITWGTTIDGTGRDISSGTEIPDTGETTFGVAKLQLDKARAYDLKFTGAEQKQLKTSVGYKSMYGAALERRIEQLVTEVSQNVADLYPYASRAVGPADGGILFSGANFKDAANARKELVLNKVPRSQEKNMVLSPTAMASILGNATNSAANTAGEVGIMQQGIQAKRMGFNFREESEIVDHEVGDAENATTDATGYAVGSTTITLASAGTGEIKAGDVITFAGDTNKYVVKTGDADVSNGGTIVLNKPGLRVAIETEATAITVDADTERNMAFTRDAILLATRVPSIPEEGDAAVDSMLITDPHSGLTFDLRMYGQYHQVRYEIGLAWGCTVANPEHLILLIQ